MEFPESPGHAIHAYAPEEGPEDSSWSLPDDFNPVHPLDRPPTAAQLILWGSAPSLFTVFAFAICDGFVEFIFGPAIPGVFLFLGWTVAGIVLCVRGADREYEDGTPDATYLVPAVGALSLFAPLVILTTLLWLTGPPSDRSLLSDYERHVEAFRDLGVRFSTACESGEREAWEKAGCLTDKLNTRKLLYHLGPNASFEAGPLGFTIAVHPTNPNTRYSTTGYAYILSTESMDPRHFQPSFAEEGRPFDSYGLRSIGGHWYLYGVQR